MKIFECKVCGHIEFDKAPEKCMVCRSPASAFSENAAAIKQPADATALNDSEKKHVPVIVVVKNCGLLPDSGCTDVHVKVGETPHVMTKEHYIRYIDLYLDHVFLSRTWLSPEKCHAAAGWHLNAQSGLITAVENCNVHGNWISEASI